MRTITHFDLAQKTIVKDFCPECKKWVESILEYLPYWGCYEVTCPECGEKFEDHYPD